MSTCAYPSQNLTSRHCWLRPHPESKSACQCKCCNVVIQGGKSEILKHAKTVKHRRNMANLENQRTITKMFGESTSEYKKRIQHEKHVKESEILISSFFAEHNIAFLTCDHLTAVLKRAFFDSEILKDFSLHRSKCTAIVRNVLGKQEEVNLVKELKEAVFFSVLVDETTDLSSHKLMCILVKYVSPCTGKVMTKLLELCPLDATDCSAEKLFHHFKTTLEKKGLHLDNILGVASDGANVMIGKHNSFFSRISNLVPHAILLQCICHSAALVASKACAKLPYELEELMKQTYSYVSGSSKHCAQLVEIQTYFNMKQLKILRLSGTRWLSTHQTVVRMLENWEALLHYFRIAACEDGLDSAQKILDLLESRTVKAYYLFLKYSLNYMYQFNALFQSKDTLTHLLHRNSKKLFRQFAQNFIKPMVLMTDISFTKIVKSGNYQNIEHVFTGIECEQFLKTLPQNESEPIRVNILSFYVTLAEEMIKRLPLTHSIYAEFEFISPDCTFNKDKSVLADLPLLCDKYKHLCSVNEAINEWRNLPYSFEEDEIKYLKSLPIDIMWRTISQYKDFKGNFKFCNISKLATFILSLPHSNAEAERIFSCVNDIKTKKRNRLGDDNLNAMCLVRSSFSATGLNCTSFVPSKEHLDLCNNI